MPTQQQRSPMAQIPLLNKMKRKRSDGTLASPLVECSLAKRRTENMSHVQIPAAEIPRVILPRQEDLKAPGSEQISHGQGLSKIQCEGADENNPPQHCPPEKWTQSKVDHPSGETDWLPHMFDAPASLREAIEAQFSLEILLKHRELRLVDQEFAKCQTALEQLRRCQVFPYQALSSTFEGMQAASTGSGKAYENRAPHAPPWGVANGPYTRHYERWLIPDSIFDDTISDHVRKSTYGGEFGPERSTRGSKAEKGTVASKSRSQRGSTGARLKALPTVIQNQRKRRVR